MDGAVTFGTPYAQRSARDRDGDATVRPCRYGPRRAPGRLLIYEGEHARIASARLQLSLLVVASSLAETELGAGQRHGRARPP
jgi:hypothetical protein